MKERFYDEGEKRLSKSSGLIVAFYYVSSYASTANVNTIFVSVCATAHSLMQTAG